jgi:6-phosphogluconolactonase/glucosamine-6-phosphate isomerase/deaminase
MHHELQAFDDLDALARGAARFVSEHAHSAETRVSPFTFALSGGQSPWLMIEELVTGDVAWGHSIIYQVDERVAPEGSELRNLTHLHASVATTGASIEAMGVNDDDLDAAAARYAALLPARLDLVHLGLGPDGHCASLVPNDPVLEVTDRLVALSGPYQGTRRMTLTYPALARADQLLWLVSGTDKHDALEKLLDGDQSIPAGRVEADRSTVMVDRQTLKP